MMKNKNPWHEVDEWMSDLESDTSGPKQPTALAGLMFRMQKVSVALAKINEKSTRRVVHLTWALLALTAVLLGVAVVQTVLMFCNG